MGLTIRLPIEPNPRGGIATTKKPVPQLIATALIPGRAGDPYLTRDGADSDPLVWEPANGRAAEGHARRVFRQFEQQGIARLGSSRSTTSGVGDDGQQTVTVDYQDLETGEAATATVGMQVAE